jgi:hypothetical protein
MLCSLLQAIKVVALSTALFRSGAVIHWDGNRTVGVTYQLAYPTRGVDQRVTWVDAEWAPCFSGEVYAVHVPSAPCTPCPIIPVAAVTRSSPLNPVSPVSPVSPMVDTVDTVESTATVVTPKGTPQKIPAVFSPPATPATPPATAAQARRPTQLDTGDRLPLRHVASGDRHRVLFVENEDAEEEAKEPKDEDE